MERAILQNKCKVCGNDTRTCGGKCRAVLCPRCREPRTEIVRGAVIGRACVPCHMKERQACTIELMECLLRTARRLEGKVHPLEDPKEARKALLRRCEKALARAGKVWSINF